MQARKANESRTVTSIHVLPGDTNNHGTLFGGKLMMYVDNIAGIVARRHSRQLCVTASIDSVDFLEPINQGNSICLEGIVTWTHNTSMEIFVKVITEDLITGIRKLCTTCFLTFVALDKDGRPVPVPPVIPGSDEEKKLFNNAEKRYLHRQRRRSETKEFASTISLKKPWDK